MLDTWLEPIQQRGNKDERLITINRCVFTLLQYIKYRTIQLDGCIVSI